jgi:hypothetical protein
MAYNQKQIETIFELICERIEVGQSVNLILKDSDMPSSRTFWKWLDEDEEKVKKYARAKDVYSDKMFEDLVLIADGTSTDVYQDEKGEDQINHDIIQRDRLRIDARKWTLSKLNPKKYGDNQKEPGATVNYNVNVDKDEIKGILDDFNNEL